MTSAEAATAHSEAIAVTHRGAGVPSRGRGLNSSRALGLPRSPFYELSKRIVDVVVASFAIIVFAPLMLLIAIAVKIESRGPIWFGHIRVGRNRRAFACWKFRSMRVGAAEELLCDPSLRGRYVSNDYKVPVEVDPRVTRVGRFLRRTSLDELPQLFNVLMGSMTLVGPRPIVREELRWYGEHVDTFLGVKPGITGVWQVQGRSRIGYPERVNVELDGIRTRSFWSDLKILARSVPAVIMARGAL